MPASPAAFGFDPPGVLIGAVIGAAAGGAVWLLERSVRFLWRRLWHSRRDQVMASAEAAGPRSPP